MIDYFYQGAVSLGHNVDFYPERKFYQIPLNLLKTDSLRLLQPEKSPRSLTFFQAWFALYKRKYDLIVLSPLGYGRKKNLLSSFSVFIKSLARKELSWRYVKLFPTTAPAISIDGVDETECNTILINSVSLKRYYKRELKKWPLTGVSDGVLPIRFGINVIMYNRLIPDVDNRSMYDICYIMSSSNHDLRKKVKDKLSQLTSRYNIFLHDSSSNGKISLLEYIKIVQSSKITLSISGLGWDCLRHYEVPVIGSVLFVNEPTIETGDFFKNGKECIMFKNDLSDFLPKIEFYLSDDNKRSLDEIREAGIKAVEDRFDVSATAKYIIQSSIG